MNLLKLINDLSEVINDAGNNKENDVKVLDIKNDNDYDEFIKTVNELKNDDFMKSLFGDNEDIWNSILEIAHKYHESNKPTAKKNESLNTKIVAQEPLKSEEKKIERPSENISVNMGLQIHKLVQEYIDTMIKPYNPKVGGLSKEAINDAYAGLYEFACWIYNHK